MTYSVDLVLDVIRHASLVEALTAKLHSSVETETRQFDTERQPSIYTITP